MGFLPAVSSDETEGRFSLQFFVSLYQIHPDVILLLRRTPSPAPHPSPCRLLTRRTGRGQRWACQTTSPGTQCVSGPRFLTRWDAPSDCPACGRSLGNVRQKSALCWLCRSRKSCQPRLQRKRQSHRCRASCLPSSLRSIFAPTWISLAAGLNFSGGAAISPAARRRSQGLAV